MQKDEIQIALDRFKDHIIQQSKRNLTLKNKNVSKSLYNSIKGTVKVMPNSIGIYFEMDEYGQYQDQGVRGANPSLVKNGKQKAPNSPYKFSSKMPPMSPLKSWAKKRNLRFRSEGGKYKKGDYDTIGFWLQKRIFAQGIKPSLFFTKPFNAAFKNLPNELVEKYGLESEKLFNDIIKQPK